MQESLILQISKLVSVYEPFVLTQTIPLFYSLLKRKVVHVSSLASNTPANNIDSFRAQEQCHSARSWQNGLLIGQKESIRCDFQLCRDYPEELSRFVVQEYQLATRIADH